MANNRNPNIAEEGKPYRFKKGHAGNPNGRPKKIENVLKDFFLNEYNIKLHKTQAEDIIKSLLTKTRSELIELANNEELPFWIALIVKKAQRDYSKGSIHILDVLFDRVYGKPSESVDHTTKGESIVKANFGSSVVHTTPKPKDNT